MKIGTKLVTMIIILNFIGIGILISTSLRISYQEIITLVNGVAINTAGKDGNWVQNFLESHLDILRSLTHVMEQYDEIHISERNNLFDSMFHSALLNNQDALAIWTIWKPHTILDDVPGDGFTVYPPGTERVDAQGRYTSYWEKTETGLKLDGHNWNTIEDYYQLVLRDKTELVLDPYFKKIGSRDILITSLIVPIRKQGQILGLVGFDIDMAPIQQLLTQNKPFGNGWSAVFSNNGRIVAHFDSTRIGKYMQDTEKDMSGSYLEGFVKSLREGNIFTYSIYIASMSSKMHIFSVPIQWKNNRTPWAWAIAVSEKTIMAPLYRILVLNIAIGLGMMAIISGAAFLISRSISGPINNTMQMLKDISMGEGDLTKQLKVLEHNEIGDMSRFFNLTFNKIRSLIILIKGKTLYLRNTGTELASNMTETASAVNEITSHIQSMKIQVKTQADEVLETHASMERILNTINTLNEHISVQSESVDNSSSAIEEMMTNIHSVVQTLIQNNKHIKALTEASTIGRNGIKTVSLDLQGIIKESEGLLEINALMENIATQTNLLSMNAAIEAAHAGEAGKGFAVVAGEIRKLAESSAEQSKTTTGVLKKIKDAIDSITYSTQEVLNRFEVIDKGVQVVSNLEEQIFSAMKEQETGSKQILDAVNQLSEITDLVRNQSNEMASDSKDIIGKSSNLERISHEIAQGMDEMVTGAEQINTTISRINTISMENKSNINALSAEVAKFKVE